MLLRNNIRISNTPNVLNDATAEQVGVQRQIQFEHLFRQ